jgi:hypothetical protein
MVGNHLSTIFFIQPMLPAATQNGLGKSDDSAIRAWHIKPVAPHRRVAVEKHRKQALNFAIMVSSTNRSCCSHVMK